MKPLRIGIVGVGKIAREQHIPAISACADFELAACANCSEPVEGIPNFSSLKAMLDSHPDLGAIAVCTPPQAHYEAALLALQRGKHVFLEKPPCTTTTQLSQLALLARQKDRTLFQTWHARHAAAVDATQRWLESCVIRKASIVWKEDVLRWHPRQSWLWQAGGFGVFDAGINAISILTKIVAEPIFVKAADLFFPTNCATPIAAEATFVTDGGTEIDAAFDFRHTGAPTWEITIATDRGTLCLADYGNMLIVDGKQIATGKTEAEYPSLYRRFAELIQQHESDVDKRPLQLIADIFLVGSRKAVEPFEAL